MTPSLAGGTFCAACWALFLFVAAGVPPAGIRKENGKMKIRYEFVNGDVSEIEVDEELGGLLLDFDRQEYNNDHRERRRHVSLDGMDYEGELFASVEDTAGEAVRREDAARLAAAMEALSPAQRDLVLKVYFGEQRISDIARAEGVSKQSVHERVGRALKKLKKILG